MIIESNRVYFEISNWFWAHQNLCPNLDKLAKNKNMKPPQRKLRILIEGFTQKKTH